jgi:hypothetical protein
MTKILNHTLELTIYGKDTNTISFEISSILTLLSKDENAKHFFSEDASPTLEVQAKRVKDDGTEFYSDNDWSIGEMAEWLGFSTLDLILQFHDIIDDIKEMADDIKRYL